MSHEHGAYLGGVRDLASLRERCVVDDACGCWHFRLPRTGRPAPRDRTITVHVHGRGKVAVARAAWEFAKARSIPRGKRVMRTCASHDCANPKHLRLMSMSDSMRYVRSTKGALWDTIHRVRSTVVNRRTKATKLTHELAAWARQSAQPSSHVAHALDVPKSRVIAIRAGKAWAPLRAAP